MPDLVSPAIFVGWTEVSAITGRMTELRPNCTQAIYIKRELEAKLVTLVACRRGRRVRPL